MKNIYYVKSNKRYCIQKQMHGVRYYYGSYTSLEEAQKYRDYLESKGWAIEPNTFKELKKVGGVDAPKKRIARMFHIDVEEI